VWTQLGIVCAAWEITNLQNKPSGVARGHVEPLKPVANWPEWAEEGLRTRVDVAWQLASEKHRHNGNLGSALRRFVSMVAPEVCGQKRAVSMMKQLVLCPLFENRAPWHPSVEKLTESVMRSAEYATFMEMVSHAAPPIATPKFKHLSPAGRAARLSRDKRKVEIRAIKSQHPEWSQFQICIEMDRRMLRKKNIEPLPTWKDGNGNRLSSWKACYNEKPNVQTNVRQYISKA
jgi:hypothetical protein